MLFNPRIPPIPIFTKTKYFYGAKTNPSAKTVFRCNNALSGGCFNGIYLHCLAYWPHQNVAAYL